MTDAPIMDEETQKVWDLRDRQLKGAIAFTTDLYGQQRLHTKPPVFNHAAGIWMTPGGNDACLGLSTHPPTEPVSEIRPGHEVECRKAQQEYAEALRNRQPYFSAQGVKSVEEYANKGLVQQL